MTKKYHHYSSLSIMINNLPYFIADMCDKKFIPMVYLSSLSVYGIPKRKSVDVSSEKVPFTNYGKTKHAFDQLLKTKLKNHF